MKAYLTHYRLFGIFLMALAVLMVPPVLVDYLNNDPAWTGFFFSAVGIFYVALALIFAGQGYHEAVLTRKGAIILVVGSWFLLALAGAMPFWLSGSMPSLTDAVFESVSGLTTTGASILPNVEAVSMGTLLWRGELQWIGGIGIVVAATILFPFLGIAGYQAFSLESSEVGEKPLPRIEQTGKIILLIYLALTTVCALLYLVLDMSVLDAIIHSMTTVSTGGFSTSAQSIGGFQSDPIEWVCIFFMIAGAIPFSAYMRALSTRQPQQLFRDSQVPVFLLIVASTAIILALWLAPQRDLSYYDALRLTTFNIVSVITTTGFASDDYVKWGTIPVMFFLYLTFLGGCAGSTSGGFKTYRLIMNIKIILLRVRKIMHPHSVSFIKYNGTRVSRSTVDSLISFSFLWVFMIFAGTLILEWSGLDFLTALSAASTALANVGPGIVESIGPSGSFADLPGFAKWVLSFMMLLGRLELTVLLIIFFPSFWRI